MLLRFGGEYAGCPLVPFRQWLEAVRRDAALSLWPLMQRAAGRDAFPVYNTRRPAAGGALRFVDAAAAAALRRGADEQTWHKMLEFLRFGPACR